MTRPGTIKQKVTTRKNGKAEKPEKVAPPIKPRQMNAFERVTLMRAIADARAVRRPKAWTTLSKELGVEPRTLQRLHKQYLDYQGTLTDPVAVVDEGLLIYSEAIQGLAEDSANGENGSIRTQATRAMVQITRERLELLAALNRLPRRFDVVDEGKKFEAVFSEMAQVLEQMDAPPELIEALIGVIERAQDEQPRQLAAGMTR